MIPVQMSPHGVSTQLTGLAAAVTRYVESRLTRTFGDASMVIVVMAKVLTCLANIL